MIKLIATDLDGTFLDSKKNKPAVFPDRIIKAENNKKNT